MFFASLKREKQSGFYDLKKNNSTLTPTSGAVISCPDKLIEKINSKIQHKKYDLFQPWLHAHINPL